MANEFKVRNGLIAPNVQLAGSTSGTSTISASSTATGSYTWPASVPGTNGYVLSSTTGGVLSWVAQTGGGSAISVSDEGTLLTSTATSFNFVGANVTATNTSGAVTVTVTSAGGTFTGGTISGATTITDATASTSKTTGALTVTGGVGISGVVYVGSNINLGNTGSVKYSNGDAIGYTYTLDDISSKFNGLATVFPLTINNGTGYNPGNPNKLSLQIGGVPIYPSRTYADYLNLPVIPTFQDGYILTPTTIASVAIADLVGTLTVTAGTYYVGQPITITGAFNAGSITNYDSLGTVYYVGLVTSSTSIKITDTYANATAATPVFALTTTTGQITPGPNAGATVTIGSTIKFATAPSTGMKFFGTVQTSQDPAPTFNYSQAPFSALSIMGR